jgi:hypothetical protein
MEQCGSKIPCSIFLFEKTKSDQLIINEMIQKQLTYEPRLNGFTNWIETFFEVTSHLAITVDDSSSLSHAARCRGGQSAVRELAERLTDEFEVRYHDGYHERWQISGLARNNR